VPRLPCVLAAAACLAAGIPSYGAKAHAAATPAQCEAPGTLARAEAKKFLSNCLLCALVGVRGISSTYHVSKGNPAALARALAQKTAPPELRKAVEDGCLRGFHLAAAKGKPPGQSPPAKPPHPTGPHAK
jgi:hypothetical protein